LTLRLLREPLLQFLVLGAMLFALYGLLDKRSVEATETIVVSTSQIANLRDVLHERGGGYQPRRNCRA
jgi:hypothetical protein